MDKSEDTKDNKIVYDVGAISYKALLLARDSVKVGVKLIDVANLVEKFVKEQGYQIAFPMNISINNIAAHYTPCFEDTLRFADKDIIKLDFGAQKDGILGDCAITVDLSQNNQKLVDATNAALQNAIATVKAGATLGSIGKAICDTIESMGLKPIKNLGGHGVTRHILHDAPFIPNFDNDDDEKLKEGDIIAIEPFATNGKGMVRDSDTCEIYELASTEGITRSKWARLLLDVIKKDYLHEPFAVRWLSSAVESRFALYAGISELSRSGIIDAHPVLVEVANGMVAQSEAQVLVEKDGCKVLTKLAQ